MKKQNENKNTNIAFIILLIIIAIMFGKMGWVVIKYELGGFFIDKKYERIEMGNREENTQIAERWVKEVYGATLSEVIELKYAGKVNGWVSWSEYYLNTPFANGSVIVNTEKHKVESGGFNLRGSKFQHNYSEWVKKQVGIEDENVELGFTWIFEEPYIDFDKITTLSEDYKEVFENTHNCYLTDIIVENSDISDDNFIDYFNYVKDNIYMKSYYITGKPEEKYVIFIYIDDYCFYYDYPDEKISRIRKKNKNPRENDGKLWSTIY